MRHRARLSLLCAAFGVGLLVLLHQLAFHSAWAQSADRNVLQGFTDLNRPRIHTVLNGIAHLGDPKPFTVLALVLVAVALIRHRPRVAVAVAAILAGANVTTQ